MTGELFASLTRSATLAGLMAAARESPSALAAGVDAARTGALSHMLCGCRARVVVDAMPAHEARSYPSGLLIGAEWHDIRAHNLRHQNKDKSLQQVAIIASPALARDYARVAAMFDAGAATHEPDRVYAAALRRFMTAWR